MPRTHPVLYLVLALGIALPLCACGGKTSSDATAGGAATPVEVVARTGEIAEKNDPSLLVPLVLPEQRASLTLMMGIFPTSMVLGMAEGFGKMMRNGGDDAKLAKLAAWKKEWEALLAKYEIETPKKGEGSDLITKAMGAGQAPEERRALFAECEKFLGHVDHQAFIHESVALMGKYADKTSKGRAERMAKKFDMTNAKIEVEGDRATVTVPAEKTPLVIVKRDGRWYIDLAEGM